jgi:hypothetical protein
LRGDWHWFSPQNCGSRSFRAKQTHRFRSAGPRGWEPPPLHG